MHKPLSNGFLLVSIIGFIITLYIWSFSSTIPELIPWLFLFMLFFVILFISSFVSAVRAPLATDHDIALAIHEEFKKGRYPDTDLHKGMLKKKAKKKAAKKSAKKSTKKK